MKRPRWATVVGILGMIVAFFGITASGQMLTMPKMIKLQHQIMHDMEASLKGKPKDQAELQKVQDVIKQIIGQVPDWFKTAVVIFGVLGVIVNGVYIFACIALLLVKRYAIRWFYVAVALSIALAVSRGIAAVLSTKFIGLGVATIGLVGIVLDVILLVVVATGGKEAFLQEPTFEISQ
jgi:hypothetical protein